MALLEANAAGILPAHFAPLILDPLGQQSVAMRTSNVMHVVGSVTQVPFASGPTSGWVAEGATITETDPAIAEITLTPKKLAALTILSRELATDSSPAAVNVVGQSIARSLRIQLDKAFLSASAPVTNAPGGVLHATGIGTGALSAATGLDGIVDAIATIEAAGWTPDAAVMAPATWSTLAKVKIETGSVVSLLSSPTQGVGGDLGRSIFGLPVYLAPGCPADTVAVWDSHAIAFALREDVTVAVSNDYAFKADSVAVRATLRADWAPVDVNAVVALTYS